MPRRRIPDWTVLIQSSTDSQKTSTRRRQTQDETLVPTNSPSPPWAEQTHALKNVLAYSSQSLRDITPCHCIHSTAVTFCNLAWSVRLSGPDASGTQLQMYSGSCKSSIPHTRKKKRRRKGAGGERFRSLMKSDLYHRNNHHPKITFLCHLVHCMARFKLQGHSPSSGLIHAMLDL